MIERDQLAALQGENTHLIALLEDHGIEWRSLGEPAPPEPLTVNSLCADESSG